MNAISGRTKVLTGVVLLVAAFVAGCVCFGIMPTLLIVAIAASAAMVSVFLVVASSRSAY